MILLVNRNLVCLQRVPYPFEHARGKISIADYARVEETFSNEIERAFRESRIHCDRIHSLYFRIIGRLVLIAQYVEAAIFPPTAA